MTFVAAGHAVGAAVGADDGGVGASVGPEVGAFVGGVGTAVGVSVGATVGSAVGASVSTKYNVHKPDAAGVSVQPATTVVEKVVDEQPVPLKKVMDVESPLKE